MGLSPTIKSFDILQSISKVVLNAFNKRPTQSGTSPCDGAVLKLYYKITFWLFFGGYAAIAYNWWTQDVLKCVSKFSADQQMRPDYLNICASYLYIEDESSPIGERKFLLFYRWVHWVLLGMAFLSYIPYKILKRTENPKLKKLFDHLECGKQDSAVKSACDYYTVNSGSHNIIYAKHIMLNIFSLLILGLMFYLIDFIFLGNFSDLGYSTFPFVRDITSFTDELSIRFPPFALCEITPFHLLMNKRSEKFGCHLTYMELYEKYFVILWVWMIILAFVTIIYIIYVLCFNIRGMRLCCLSYYKPYDADDAHTEFIDEKLRNLKVGDYFLLYKMKSCLSPDKYYELLSVIFDSKAVGESDTCVEGKKQQNDGRRSKVGGFYDENIGRNNKVDVKKTDCQKLLGSR